MAVRTKARSHDARPSEQILPEAEMEVLAVLQERGEADAKQVREALAPFRPMSHASVLTLLGRLVTKKFVSRRKGDVGKAYVYSASKPADPITRGLLKRMVRRIFANDPARLVASLFDAKPPSAAELQQIRELVEKMEKRS